MPKPRRAIKTRSIRTPSPTGSHHRRSRSSLRTSEQRQRKRGRNAQSGHSSRGGPRVRRLAAGGRWIRTLGPPSEGQRFSRLLFRNMRARHRRLPKRSPPRPAAASSSCRSRSDERRTHSPTRRSSGPPDRRHHHPFALITALCFSRVRFISCSCAVALASRGRAPP